MSESSMSKWDTLLYLSGSLDVIIFIIEGGRMKNKKNNLMEQNYKRRRTRKQGMLVIFRGRENKLNSNLAFPEGTLL